MLRKHEKIRNILPVLIIVVVMGGCATPAAITDMTPSLNYTDLVSTDKTLMVVLVEGGKKIDPIDGKPTIENEGFQQALKNVLQISGMFKSVIEEGIADYKLHTEILYQEVGPGFNNNATLFVNYRLIEMGSDRDIWKENLLSHYTAMSGEAGLGVERMKKALEGAARDNLSQLVRKLVTLLEPLEGSKAVHLEDSHKEISKSSIEKRLEALQDLLNEGLISEEEYQIQRSFLDDM
jgi:hypothetical protein